ncbi:PREDICTED: focadhesin isoform X2 [Wasmannia auropunctata]|uniref:focadhesin isoform X2 n=1 Tax=Wasmannia auropunctata TaxID=64793 RepID=UPI0005EE4FEC|nr:PREDICTED: focadhesin isoform X2 [Wasmannia auropunctata]
MPIFFKVCTNYEIVTVVVSRLLILDWKSHDKSNEYTLETPTQHPFIAILAQEKLSWRCVLNQMKFIMHHHDKHVMEQSAELLRPVFVHILCNPSMDLCESCKQEAWQLVIKSSNTTDLRTEILLWLCTNRADICVDANCRVLELADMALLKRDREFCTALMPLIASLTIQLLECGHEPVQNFCTILDLFECCYNYIGDIMIVLMAEIILICPAVYLLNALEICTVVVDKMPCHLTLLNTLAASLLKWLAYPSLLCSDALVTAKELLIKIMSRKETDTGDGTLSNKTLLIFSYSNRYIQFYMELIRSLYSLKDDTLSWLESLSLAPIDLRYMCKLVLCGIFLRSDESPVVQKVCHILVQTAREINSFASHMLSLLLHKLTKTHDSSTLKYLLLTVPEFAMTKDNLPIVIRTLETLLNSGRPLKYLAIQLYIKALEKEPRCYRFVSTALMDTMEKDRSWRSDVTCARAIRYICENRPEHGEELVPLLSQILNRCVDQSGGAASALALDSISALCKSTVIGIYSTWQVLAPKMRKEKRTVVLESLCDLFANIPSYLFRTSEDYDRFMNDVVTHLWGYTVCDDTRVAKAAFKALRSYPVELIPLTALPREFRSDVVVQHASGKTGNEGNKLDSSLQHIPGTCWIQMLRNVNRSVLPAAGDLLISYIRDELNAFRSRIYSWPQGEPQNFKYLPERSVIRAVGEYLRRGDKTDPSNRIVTVECLRIFAHKHKKPLPNVKWDFLKDTMKISREAKEYGVSIASRQCEISQSAKSLTERFLSMYTSTSEVGRLLLDEKHLVLYSNLEELCQAVQPNNLKKFLEITLNYAVDRILLNNEKSAYLFNHIMSSYVGALKNNSIQMGNRTLLATMLDEVSGKVDLTSKHFEKYFEAVVELLPKDVERMTSPDTWWVVTPEKLKTAIIVRVQSAFTGYIGTPFTWLHELINATEFDLEMQKYLLESVQKMQADLRLEKSCNLEIQKDWILDFMRHIDGLMVEPDKKNNVTFYCDILFILIICLSGMECLLPKKELLITSQDIRIRLFPQAIAMLIDRQIWKSITRQIMNWLNHMRSSSVPDVYILAFQSALILLRHEEDYNSEWKNYLSVKTRI